MTYAVNKGGQFYSGGGSIVPVYYCPPAALYRYNTAPRQESGEAVLYRYTGTGDIERPRLYVCLSRVVFVL